jgi:hypothetical protein
VLQKARQKMRIRGFWVYTLLVGVLGTGAAPLPAPEEVAWLDSYGDAIREAKRTQKPIFLEFRCEA